MARPTVHYSDSIETRPSKPLGQQRGPTTTTVLEYVAPITDEQKRGARIQAKRFVVDNALTAADAGELIAALGAER